MKPSPREGVSFAVRVSRYTQLLSVFRQFQRNKHLGFVHINLAKGIRDFGWQELGIEM